MISNQILQNTIEGLKAIANTELCILDMEGKIIASTSLALDLDKDEVLRFVKSTVDFQEIDGCLCYKIFDDLAVEYILAAAVTGQETVLVGKMAAYQIQSLVIAYKERFDKDNFIKNLLLDNLLLIDIFNRAKKLHIDVDRRRVVMILETGTDQDPTLPDKIKALLEDNPGDFVTAVDEKGIIVVKSLEPGEGYEKVDIVAEKILKLVEDAPEKIHLAYGTIVKELKDVSRSYKEARMALDVGQIFFDEKGYFAYSALGIGRLIYQLPIPLCRMFIKEIFANKSPDDFDEETIVTINKFFENNLNVSETSRQLYIHRNTLVYRLDKLQKSTGLDLRVFEDAITFKIALMVVRYMKYMEKLDY